jgi:uncharacterized protein (TIGR03067 family)
MMFEERKMTSTSPSGAEPAFDPMNRWSDFWTLCKVGVVGIAVLSGIGLIIQKVSETSLWRGIARSVAPDDRRDIQGKWLAVMGEYAGRPAPVQKGSVGVRFTIQDDRVEIAGGTEGKVVVGKFALDPSRGAIDLIGPKPGGDEEEVGAGIYRLTANRLELCIADPGRPRPKGFETSGTDRHSLWILERE